MRAMASRYFSTYPGSSSASGRVSVTSALPSTRTTSSPRAPASVVVSGTLGSFRRSPLQDSLTESRPFLERRPADRFEQLCGHPDRSARREVHASVAGVARDERLPSARDQVLEAQGGAAQVRELGAEDELVVEEGRLAVVGEDLHDHYAVAARFQLLVREAGGPQPLDAAHLEVREADRVVDVPLRVYLRVADAEPRLVDQRPLNSGLRFSTKAPMPSRASSVAKRRGDLSASYPHPPTRTTSLEGVAAALAGRTP